MYQLMDRGYIKSLDDPLTDYCPNFSIKNPYDLENVVTLRYTYVIMFNTYIYVTGSAKTLYVCTQILTYFYKFKML